MLMLLSHLNEAGLGLLMAKLSRRNTIFNYGNERDVMLTSMAAAAAAAAAGNKRTKSDVTVLLNRPDNAYNAGDTIAGRVDVYLTQDIRAADLSIRILGYGRVSWDEQRTYTKGSAPSVCRKNTEVYVDNTMSLIKRDSTNHTNTVTSCSSNTTSGAAEADDGVLLVAGSHSFPFEYTLSRDLPSSYSGRWGQVKYVIKVKLQRPWKFDIDREAELFVMSSVDLNEEPELARPTGALNEFYPSLMCLRSGPITFEIRVVRRGFAIGDVIQMSAEIENNSRFKLFHCRLSLIQHVIFRAGRKQRKVGSVVSSSEKSDVLPGTRAQWTNETMTVPCVLPSSHKLLCRNIEIKYTLSVSGRFSSWTEPICLTVPVTLGTLPMRRQTISSYLSMLAGYQHSPRSSPVATHKFDTNAVAITSGSVTSSSMTSSSSSRPTLTVANTQPSHRTSASSSCRDETGPSLIDRRKGSTDSTKMTAVIETNANYSCKQSRQNSARRQASFLDKDRARTDVIGLTANNGCK